MSCHKKRHKTEQAAFKHLKSLASEIKNDIADIIDLNIYFCQECRSFHVGHKKYRKMELEFLKSMMEKNIEETDEIKKIRKAFREGYKGEKEI